jgi:hypothetical protein
MNAVAFLAFDRNREVEVGFEPKIILPSVIIHDISIIVAAAVICGINEVPGEYAAGSCRDFLEDELATRLTSLTPFCPCTCVRFAYAKIHCSYQGQVNQFIESIL